MNKNIVIGSVIAIVIVVGFVFFVSQKPQENSNSNPTAQTENTSEGKMVAGYSGKVLAGSTSPYLTYTKADYDKALASGKVVYLDFYANWCPICREETPVLKEGFDSLQTDKIVGFRVNYNDTKTDQDEKNLAQQLGITYQHTKVILKNGKEVYRTLEAWDKDTFTKEINLVTN